MVAKLWSVILLLLLTTLNISCSNRGSSNGDVANSTYGLKLNILDGNNQKTMPGRLFIKPLTVQATNIVGEPVADLSIDFSVTSGSGFYLTPSTVKTGPSGIAAIEVKGPDAYNAIGQILAKIEGTPITQVFSIATNDSVPGVHFEIESTLGTKITAGKEFGFIVKLVNADGSIVNYTGPMETIWNMSAGNSWGGLAPKNLLTSYSCAFVGGVCYTPASGSQAIVLYDSRTPTTIFMGDGNSGYMDVFAYDITVIPDVPAKVAIANGKGGPNAGAKVINELVLTADDSPMNLAPAITDVSGNYITDGGSVNWSSDRVELSSYFSSNTGDMITLTPTKTITAGNFGYVYAQHPSYSMASSGKVYIDPGLLNRFKIEKVGGGTTVTAGEPFQILIRAVDAKENSVGQNSKGSGFHGTRVMQINTTNYQSGSRPTGGEVPWFGLTSNLDDDGNGNLLPGWPRTSIINNSNFSTFFNLGETTALANDYRMILFDATNTTPTLTVSTGALTPYPAITGSTTFNVVAGPPHHLMLRQGAGPEAQSYCELPTTLAGPAASYSLKTMVLEPFAITPNPAKTETCFQYGTMTFTSGQTAPNIYYAIEDIAGNWIANVSGTFSTSYGFDSANSNSFRNRLSPSTGLSQSLTLTGTLAGRGGIEISADYTDPSSGTAVTYRSYLIGTVSPSEFDHFDFEIVQAILTSEPAKPVLPNIWADRNFEFNLVAYDAANNKLYGTTTQNTGGTALLTVTPTGALLSSPDGTEPIDIPETSIITMSTTPNNYYRIYERRMWIPNIATGGVTFSITGATNGAPDRSITLNPIAGPLTSIDIRTASGSAGSSIIGQQVNLTTDDNTTFYASGFDTLGNFASMPVATWSVENLSPADSLIFAPTGNTSLFQPSKPGTADKIKVVYNNGGTTLTAESGPVTLTSGMFHHISVNVPNGTKTAGVPFNVTLRLKDQKGNTLSNLNGPQLLTINVVDSTPTLSNYVPSAPPNGNYVFVNGETTLPFTFYNSSDTNPQIQVNATIGGNYRGGASNDGDIVVANSALDHLHIITTNQTINAGSTNQFGIYAEDQWGNQMKSGTGSNLRVRVNLTNSSLTSQDITATNLTSASSVATASDTTVDGNLTEGTANFTVASTTAGVMTLSASVLSGETLPGTNTMDSLTVLPLSQVMGIRWAPTQDPLTVHSASPTSPIISSNGSIAAQILDQYQNVITNNDSETINVAVVGGSRPFYSGTTAKTVVSGTATFGDLKYTKAENITLRASVGSNSLLTVDAPVSVIANGFKQTVVVMPNQTFTEGTGLESTAITGTPFATGSDVNAGTTFSVNVRLVDIAFNTVLETGAQISLVSTDGVTDPNITVSPSTTGTFTNGQANFNITVKRRGTHRLVATPIATQIGKLLASQYTVQPLSTQNLVVLLPGQTLNEGAPDLATAITGTSPTQTAGVQFNARVIATDTFFNQTPSEPGTSVSITTSDPNDTHPGSQTLSGSETTFPVTNVTALNNQTISATGSYAGSSSKLYAINPNTATKCILSYGAPQVYTPGKTPYTNALTGSPSSKTAGISFNVTAYAVDDYFNTATNYSGSVQVDTPNDPTDTPPSPSTFAAGTKQFTINPVSAGANKAIQLTCAGLSPQTPATHNIDVGAKTYLVSYFPAFQSFNSTSGHQSLAAALTTQSNANRNAGEQYTVNVVATDVRFNIVNDSSTVTLTSSDANSTAEAPKALVAGQSSFNLTNYRAGNNFTVGATGSGFATQNSTTYNVVSGSASKLLVVLPGEAFSQGQALASEASANSPNKQTVDYDYQIKVYATDNYYNQIISENSAIVTLAPSTGSLNYVSSSSIQMTNGLATFTVDHSAALASLTISPSATGYAGETSDPYEVIATLPAPTLSLNDGTTNSTSYVRQVLTTATVTDGATVNAWCLSETQSTRPVTAGTSSNNKTTCNGPSSGTRDAMNWYTSQPSNITFGATNELKTVYLWVADAANNVSLASVSLGITLDTDLPATPTLAFPSGTHTNISTPALTVTGDTDAYKYCLIEQDGGLGAPIAPLYDNVCWSSTRPTTATMGALGNRKVYLFTKDIAENISLAGGSYSQSIFHDPNAPGAFTVTGIRGNTDSVADTHLGTTLIPTVVWSTASDASTVTYNVVIKDSGIELGGNCSQSILGATTLNMIGCNLVDGQNYTVEISATDQALNVTNSGSFPFDVDNSAPAPFPITGETGGTDMTSDGLLSNGNIVIANWNDTTGETSYKVAVYRSDQTTVQCTEVTKIAGVTSHTFTGCPLSYANTYYLSVKALDDSGNITEASNSKFPFTVVPQATTYLVTLTSVEDKYAGVSVDLTITAKLPNTTTDTTFTGVQFVTFTTDGGDGDNSICNLGSNISFESPTSVTFTNGVGTVTGVKLKKAETGRTITADSTIGGVSLTGTTSPFNVLPNAEACKRFLDSNLSSGTVLTTVNLSLGQTKTVYSIGYDSYGNFIDESPITWTGTSNIISVPKPRVGTSTTVSGVESGTGFLQGSGTSAQITFTVSAGTSTWTSASTDASGKNYLGSANIIKTIFYDATSDSRQAAGTNWRQGSTAKSWYTEGLSAVRGSRDEFPAKTFIIGTDLSLDIVDATTNQLWMRFIAGSGRAINSDFGIITDVKALEGKLYISMAHSSGGGLIIIDFVTDEVFQINNTAKKSTQTILNRNSSGTLNVNTTYPDLPANEKVLALSALKISSNEYLAIGTATRALLMKTNSTVSLFASSSTTGQPITAIQLTSTSKLYFAESGFKLHRANLALPLSAPFTDSYFYDKATNNAKLANLEVTSLSIAEKVVSSTYHQLMVGSASGLTVIKENINDNSATSVNYNYQGSGTLNPSSSTNPFGTGVVQSLGESSSYLEAAHNADLTLTNTGTIDLWFRPEVDLNSASAIMSLVSKGSTAIDGSFGILFNAGGLGKLELWVRHGGFTYIVESTTTTWSKGRWYHLAGVFKPASLDLYVDGSRENQSTPDLTGFAVNTSTLRIAGNGTNGFTGAIDDLRISKIDRYSSAASFTVPNTAYSTDTTNNVYLFLFDQNSGLTATATNGTNATLNGNCWLSKPLYKGSDTAINGLDADSVVNSTSMTELITNSAWTELTNLQTTAITNASDTNIPGTGVFYYHDDGILTKDIGIIKINGVDKELYLKVR